MSKQMRTSHGEAEVFVLPPNLLEKLGINLHNITQNAQQLQEPKKRKKNKNSRKNESYSNHEGINSDSKSQKKHEESSILETANLMKKSVFLSPTFIPMVVNAIPGEVEIVNNVDSSVDLSNTAEINADFNANDNKSNKDIVEGNFELEKQTCTVLNSTTEKRDTSLICNRNGVVTRNKKKENDFYNGIQNNNFNPDVVKSSNSSKENCINHDNMQVSSTTPTMKSNLHSTPSKIIQDNSHRSTILCDSYANSDITNYEISADNIQDYSISINSNTVNNNTSGVLMDAVISNKKYFINNNSALEIDEALIIPLSMTTESTSNISLNDINGDAEDINIDIFQLNERDSDGLETASKTQKQNHENYISTEVHTNDVNIDIIKYTECDDCSDMELENMLHETEILVPNTVGVNSSDDEVINVINKKVNLPNVRQDVSDENDLCNSIEENKILISILPELMNTSSLDIFCGHNISNGSDMGCDNQNQEIVIPISITSESVENIPTNGINVDTTTYVECHETSNKRDIEFDTVLKESEILIPLALPSESINNNNINFSHVSDTESRPFCNKYEALVENEVQNESKKCCFPASSKSSDIREKDIKARISDNMVATHNAITETHDSFKGSSKTLEVNNQKNKAKQSLEFKDRIVDKSIQKHTVQNNDIYFESGIDEVNKSHKAKYAKKNKDRSNETHSLQKQIEINKLPGKVILHNQHNTEISNHLNIEKCESLQNHCEVNNIDDKVQEIAEYLKQVIQNNSKRRYNSDRGIKILKPKHGSLMKSKMFIQGVEKPGGSDEYEISFDKIQINKTYERKKVPGNSHVTSIIRAVSLKNVTRPEEDNIEINTCIEQSHSTKRQEFCLCGDFGKFTFVDDYDSLYEHVHFGSNASVNCPVETVFEIYSDEKSIVNNIEEREYTPQQDVFSEDEDCHICWQKFEYQDNKVFRSEMQSSKHSKCVKDTDLETDVSLTKSNSPMIQAEFETANISEMVTTQTPDKNTCDDNVLSSEISDTSLTEIIVEVNCEIKSSLSPNLSISTSQIHIQSEEKEDNKQQQYCGTVEESMDIQADELPTNVESNQTTHNTEDQSLETVHDSVEVAERKAIHIDIEFKENDSIGHPSIRAVDESTEIAADGAIHVDNESKENNDTTGQPSFRAVDESSKIAADKAIHVDNESKESNNTTDQPSIRAVDELTEIAADGSIHEAENVRSEKMDCNADSVEKISKTKDHKKSRKRKINELTEEPPTKKSVKCGVCQQVFSDSEWDDHISTVHCYIAWKDGQNFDFDNLLLLKNLKKRLKSDRSLVCSLCAFKTDNIEKFLSHVKKCAAPEVSVSYKTDKTRKSKKLAGSSKSCRSKCAVCHLKVDDVNWIEHISEQHHYLAWKDGEAPLNINDEEEVKTHLLNIVKIYGQLICTKCGLLRKYTPKSIKSYMIHIKKCRTDSANESSVSVDRTESSTESRPATSTVCKCAVCGEKVDASKWFEHIAQEHNYRAWKDGDVAPNFEDKDVLREHLHEISKIAGGLQCPKCGVHRKYVKPFLQHIGFCKGKEEDVSNADISKDANEISSIESPQASTEINAPSCTSTPTTSKKNSKISEKPKSTCGVCNEAVEESDWIDHISKEHNYLAWRVGEPPLDTNDSEAVWQHLHNIVSIAGKLVCAKCGKFRKYPKMYLNHISDCKGPETPVVEDSMNESLNYGVLSYLDRSLKGQNLSAKVKEVKCGVCQEVVGRNAWISHIQTAHSYVAWIDGETPLETDNEDVIRGHLQQIVDEVGQLVCPQCGTSRKYPKKFLDHIKDCSAKERQGKDKDSSAASSQVMSPYEWAECGACKQTMQINQWLNHIRIMHNYVAWKQGQAPIKNAVHAKKRLQVFIDRLGHLDCSKCGHKSDDVELYLQHVESCKENNENEIEDDETTKLAREGFYQCALCSQKIKYGEWREHSLSKHYIVAWVIGDEPIDVFNQNLIAKIMKEYQQYGGEFICKVCGISRTSGLGFFAHIISCGLSEQESNKFKMTCEVCHAKHPGIYKSQHMAAHTQQELLKQRKEMAHEDREREKQRKLDELVPTPGRRRAAEKARIVIEESVSQAKHVCQSCAFATDVKEDMDKHKCPKKRKLSDEMDISLEQDESSEEEAFPEIEEEIDEEEEDPKSEKRKRHDNSSTPRVTRIPFVVSNFQDYITKNVKDYIKTYTATEKLFPEWITCHCEAVLGDEVQEFMPPLEESCQVHISGNWRTYKRWEAVQERQRSTLFTGASIHRISWVPALGSAEDPAVNVLAVACHSGADCPQYLVDDLPEHKALIQLWDFADFKLAPPKLVFGLGLQYGTVWAMDWCPSGAQEPQPKNSHKGFVRMGLLAVACSNGMAYIYSVPYPSSVVKSDSVIHKLEPVAQLKFTMKSDRKLYQATSICWSQQKGHECVIVGYSDGSTAYYDLKTESPFLKSQENNVTIFYPFYDEKTANGTITDMDSFPIARASSVAGAVCMASPTGSVLSSRGGVSRCGRVRTHLATSIAKFLPAFPAALLAGEDIVTNLTPAELDYWGMGRRAGFLQNCCGCQHCAVVATYMSPFLRTMRPHHARCDLRKQVVAWIGTKQLAKKRKHNEDKSAAKMEEALTYEEAVDKYGIQFKLVHKVNSKDELKKAMSQYKEVNPECFPLSEVPSMAFCPSAKYHRQLAVATHAGLIFVLNV